MGNSTTLGDFLRSRRGRLRPEDLGITSYGPRRVPGLRREELAQLAGVSPTYYTRLEQGQ
ncbi:MAG: helix-turn-helix transcriptional regulator, partial [Nonomuraea sp.]|nr:helix-turn-helix transcriptional regulator [Nonomuraea sp.]